MSVPLTVLMPVYNGEAHLDEAVRSVLSQDFRDFEFLIVDDGSTDGTPAMLAAWASRDPRVRVVRNARNLGIGPTLNRGLALARGVYVARQDADDLSEPGRLGAQVTFLDAHPEVPLVSTNYVVIDEQGHKLRTIRVAHDPEVVAFLLLFSNAIGGHSQVMFRRDVVRELGGYVENLIGSEDYELWTRVSTRGPIVVLPRVGMRYRIHDDRISVREAHRQQVESRRLARRMLEAYLERPLSDDEIDALADAWRQSLPSTRPELGYALFREAYRRFGEGRPSRLRRSVRLVAARRFGIAGGGMLRIGAVGGALRHFLCATRLHPMWLPYVATGSMVVAARRLMRRWRPR